MIKLGINGFGRIGRALYRLNLEQKKFQITVINDIDSNLDNHAYLLKYDSTYGKLKKHKVSILNDNLIIDNKCSHFYSYSDIKAVPWEKHDVDAVIDASGVSGNVIDSHSLIGRGSIKKVIVTHSPSKSIDATLMLGVNEKQYDPSRHHVLSSSICDANAVAPFFKAIDDNFGIEFANITTLHPWLQYQNLLDGTIRSVSNPGHFWNDYALGRNSVTSLIPKQTSLVSALEHVLPKIGDRMHAMSFRTPTSIVSAADGVFLLKNNTNLKEIRKALDNYCVENPNVLSLDDRSLVSIDYAGTEYAAVVDTRWLSLNNKKLLKFVLWYDNEWGYSARTLATTQYALRTLE